MLASRRRLQNVEFYRGRRQGSAAGEERDINLVDRGSGFVSDSQQHTDALRDGHDSSPEGSVADLKASPPAAGPPLRKRATHHSSKAHHSLEAPWISSEYKIDLKKLFGSSLGFLGSQHRSQGAIRELRWCSWKHQNRIPKMVLELFGAVPEP